MATPKKKPEDKLKVGRRSLYRPDYCEKLVVHMKTGLSFESFAAKCDVSKDTLYEWANTHPEFSEAKKRGFEHCRLWWEEQGINGLHVGYQGGTFNTGVWTQNMKCRFREEWTDRSEVKQEITVTDVSNTQFKLIRRKK